MIRNLSIEHRVCRNNLGDSDDDFAQQYVDALAAALTDEYPDAEIEVNLKSDFSNVSQTFVDGCGDEDDGDFCNDIRERVLEIAGVVWDRLN